MYAFSLSSRASASSIFADVAERHALRDIHGECALLRHLILHGLHAVPYIGTSRAPCALCTTYFASARAAAGVEASTQPTDGSVSHRWAYLPCPGCPGLAARFCGHLRARIRAQLAEMRERRRGVPSDAYRE